ncbi:hypothetical protein AB0P21_07945 [Kribbella sp. NPDC056861]|uniref:hypothetical protein n=1 Tax=Kribbella sp. NPDC056861 TaxID=3154857 RepID=UPI003419CEF1
MRATAANIAVSDLLASMMVQVEVTTGYDQVVPHWVDSDSDTCDRREEILIAESTTMATGCNVLSATWFSRYDGAAWTNSRDIDIDHVVGLKEAWDLGTNAGTTAPASVLCE